MKKETIKKAMAMFLVASLTFSLAACGGNDDSKDEENNKPPVSEPVEDDKVAGEDDADKEKDKEDEDKDKEEDKDDVKDEDKAPNSSTSKPNNSESKPSTSKPSKPSTSKPSKPSKPVEKPVSEKSLATIMGHVYDGLGEDEMPMVGDIELTDENFESFAFIKKEEGFTGLASEAMIGSVPHSIVLVRVPEGVSAKSVAADIRANAKGNKWVCVESEKVLVKYHKQTVMLIMSFEELADVVAKNFDKMY